VIRALDAGGATVQDDLPDYPCHGDAQRPTPAILAGQKPFLSGYIAPSSAVIAALVS
jgi:hypothetical protein